MTDKATEILVIGAGVIGLACAFRLAREGKRVLLIDRDQPGLGASFGNAGHIATEQIFPLASPEVVRGAVRYLFDRESPLRIRPAYLLSILPWLTRFTWASREAAFQQGVAALTALQKNAGNEMAALLDDARAAHLLKMDGHLVLVEKPESILAAQAEIATLAQFGIGANWLSPMETNELAPDITASIEGSLRFTGTGHVVDPYAVSTALLDAFVAVGGKFAQAEVTGIESTVSGFAASTSTGTNHEAAHVIISCGAWSKKLAAQLGYPVPLDTERGYHITLPGVFPRFTIPVASYERKVIMTPMSCGLRMTGTVEFGGLRLPPEPTRFTMLARHMNALAANIPTENATTWMGFRPSLPDHLPVLGRVPDGRNIYFAFGHQHLGLTLAGITARILATQVRGDEPEISLAPFAPNRFY